MNFVSRSQWGTFSNSLEFSCELPEKFVGVLPFVGVLIFSFDWLRPLIAQFFAACGFVTFGEEFAGEFGGSYAEETGARKSGGPAAS